MVRDGARHLAAEILERHGRTFSAELGLDLARNTPSPLFGWLCACLLLSSRISSKIAMKAAKALADHRWTTAERMARSTWERRTKVLNTSGYARYDESTSRMLGETARMLVKDYQGDLRKLQVSAGRDPARERALLKAFKGLGDVGVDIFFREMQDPWAELYPFADRKALKAAKRLGLGGTAKDLAALVPRAAFPRLVAALVRVDLAKDYEAFLLPADQSRRNNS